MNGLPGTYPNNFNPRERFKSFDLQVCLAPKREDSVEYGVILRRIQKMNRVISNFAIT